MVGRAQVRAYLAFFLSVLYQFSSVSTQFVPSNFLVPLAIRSPYFNTWTTANAPQRSWGGFWSGGTTAWLGFVRVDGVNYQWLGKWRGEPITVDLNGIALTPTRTVFYMQVGPMNLNVTFMSPIEPQDPVKQSLPFSYLVFEAASIDGNPHNVQVYTDISSEWMSGNRSEIVTWNTTQTDVSSFHTIQLQTPTPFAENTNQAEDVVAYYATAIAPNLVSRIGTDDDLRGQFDSTGQLSGAPSVGSGIINNPFEVFAHAHDLGNITQTSQPLVWSLGLVRNPSIAYTTPNGQTQLRSPYFVSQFSSMSVAIDSFVKDYALASQRADAIDSKILNAASNTSSSPGFQNLLSLAARQTMGGTDLTISMGSDGKWNISDVKMFMKDVGNSRRVNPVETLYASFPFFLYMNSTYAGYLLEPLLETQDLPSNPLPFAARDLGTTYPTVLGDNQTHSQGIEQSGNMLIMALAHAQKSGDGSLIHQHYNLLKGWADYLVNNTIAPVQQVDADSESTANNTNLAVKGIIGIAAMGQISSALGNQGDSQHYAGLASSYSATWQSLALSSDHQSVLSNYGNQNSWAMEYNLYADLLLGTKVIPDSIYQTLATYYQGLVSSTIATQYGLPIDSSSLNVGNSAWTMFTAASTPNSNIRDSLISPIWTHASSNTSGTPFPLTYKLDTGAATAGSSSPAQGAMFAPLALTLSSTTILVPSNGSNHKSIVGAVVGGVVGGIAVIALILLGVFFWHRKNRSKYSDTSDVFDGPKEAVMVDQYEFNPYNSEQNASQISPSGLVTMTAATPLMSQTPINPISSKAREAMMNTPAPWTAPLTSFSVTSAGGSSHQPPSDAGGATESTLSTSEVRVLRQEMENLRRAMEEIQVERMEAPPTYAG